MEKLPLLLEVPITFLFALLMLTPDNACCVVASFIHPEMITGLTCALLLMYNSVTLSMRHTGLSHFMLLEFSFGNKIVCSISIYEQHMITGLFINVGQNS